MTGSVPATVLHIPHASFEIPATEREHFSLSDDELALELRRMTDAYTDEMFALPASEATTVRFPVSRLVVDPERFVDDAREPMSARGMGVVYTRTSRGKVLRETPDAGERARLLATYYTPHHERLARAVDAALDAHGRCLVVDCHSFPLRALPYELNQSCVRPEICLGSDVFHTAPGLLDAARRAFEEGGFTVAVNEPFAGALVPAEHYQLDPRVGALMIEVRRDLYMHEATGARRADFVRICGRVQTALRQIIRDFGPGPAPRMHITPLADDDCTPFDGPMIYAAPRRERVEPSGSDGE